eukprot:5522450-Pyramimonas_sp.AAC.1
MSQYTSSQDSDLGGCAAAPALQASRGVRGGSTARVVFSALPADPRQVLVIGEPSEHLTPLIQHVGSHQIVRWDNSVELLKDNGQFDLIVDSAGGDALPSRVPQLFP